MKGVTVINTKSPESGQYEPLEDLIEPFIELAVNKLPEALQNRVCREFVLSWDLCTPERRRSQAAQCDQKHDLLCKVEHNAGWLTATLDVDAWWRTESISPVDAAMLLSRFNPTKDEVRDAETNSNNEMGPQDFRRLRNIFVGASNGVTRTLKDWTEYARQRGLKIHSWIGEWEAWVSEGDSQQADTQPQAVTVEAAVSQPNSITTAQVAVFFDGLSYSAENWPKRLSDTKWLKPAMIALGEVGGTTGLWCPLILARLIHGREKSHEQQKTLEKLNSRFKKNTALQPWRDVWNEHYALFADAIDD